MSLTQVVCCFIEQNRVSGVRMFECFDGDGVLGIVVNGAKV